MGDNGVEIIFCLYIWLLMSHGLGCREMKSDGFRVPVMYTTLKSYHQRCKFHHSFLAGGFDLTLSKMSQTCLQSIQRDLVAIQVKMLPLTGPNNA